MTHYYLKWTRKGRIPPRHGGAAVPYRKWSPRVQEPEICVRGWHACRWEDAIHHISDELWVVELDGEIVAGNDKVAAERLRLVRLVKPINDRTLRLFAADCVRDFTTRRISDAAGAPAGAAARAAAGAAARDAAWIGAWRSAWAAGGAAAGAAAAWAAAWAVRNERLLIHYGGLNPDDFVHREAS